MTINNLDERIKRIKKEIRLTPYHKGTEHYVGLLRAKLAKLKKQKGQRKQKGKRSGFAVKKSGDATVVLIGPPSVGKSSFLNKITRAQARVKAWPFTTLTVIPGMWLYQGAKIQILDLPGIISGAALGKGRGKEVFSVARLADLLLLMVDVASENKLASILKELQQLNINLPMISVINKVDLLKSPPNPSTNDRIYISVEKDIGLKELKKMVWQRLGLIRIYLKLKKEAPDLKEPLILKEGATVINVVKKIFSEKKEFKRILLWGPSARFPGQPVSLSHQLKDEDILSFF
jgi:small GTP-binding protein